MLRRHCSTNQADARIYPRSNVIQCKLLLGATKLIGNFPEAILMPPDGVVDET